MLRLKLPRWPPESSPGLPPELRWDAPRPTISLLLSRREFLKALGIVTATAALPFTGLRRAAAAARGRFLTSSEYRTLQALCDRIIPPDTDPGARKLGAPRYIASLLATFERPRVPVIYAGGPFSGRTPFPDNDNGTPGRRRPRDSFRHFIPLSRIQELRWRAELYGSAQVPGAGFNDAALGPLVGLRDLYRNGLARVNEIATTVAGDRFDRLSTGDQDRVLGMLDGAFAPDPRRDGHTFVDILIMHTLEGCFSAPEYGGNARARGWEMLSFEGDSQPLGYSIFSRAADGYVERPDHPMTTPNPDEIGPGGALSPRPLSADGQRVQTNILTFANLLGDGC